MDARDTRERYPEDDTDRLLTGACGTFNLPPDGTPDREQIDRFADFLQWYGHLPKPIAEADVTSETWRYLMGEDVAPTKPAVSP